MIIGVPKEVKRDEYRVALIPSSVKFLVEQGHTVYVEKSAGDHTGFTDDLYIEAGATILDSASEVYSHSEIIVKVKEPQEQEYALLKNGQTIFAYFHLVLNPELTNILIKKKITAISYETIEKDDGSLPLLKPMSEIAGRMSVQLASRFLENCFGGNGKLLGGVPGVYPAEVVIVGGGTVGQNAAKIAVGMGANVTVLDISPEKLSIVETLCNGQVCTAISNPYNLEKYISRADVVIGAVLDSSKIAPKVITEDMVKKMNKGSIIIDVSINQGGCVETISEPTYFDAPVVEKYGVLHYAIVNMPSAVARTATISLNNYALPYVNKVATKGFIAAVKSTPEFYKGVNTFQGKLTNPDIAASNGLPFSELSMLIGF